ncbi:alpha/beta hydrolase [Lentibacillus cibarius]|uniref:Alpha/beta fold hydrolase n=1 Tax=Lentibacillus cibarius TaxID=2583219 RepID=A0A5S3QPS9_9BACI|nr:alpha/beta fold hydrolase [Lentibacillus cibarius]TMN22556.1 alpha/beta fold hydrolase [Lentibacillus cibarius]
MIGCLIIHGYTGGPHEVEPLAAYLREHTNWEVEVPTLPGHGKNLELAHVTHTAWLDAAENELEHMKAKTDKLYLIGFSMGGMIAAYLASKHDIEKLVLLAPARKYLSFLKMVKEVKGVLMDVFKGKIGENRFLKHYKNKWRDVPFKANLEFLKLVNFTRRHLAKVQVPVLIAQGLQDMMVPYKTVHRLDREIMSDQKEVVLFDRSKHLLCLGDDKDTLNAMVYQFLTEEDSN